MLRKPLGPRHLPGDSLTPRETSGRTVHDGGRRRATGKVQGGAGQAELEGGWMAGKGLAQADCGLGWTRASATGKGLVGESEQNSTQGSEVGCVSTPFLRVQKRTGVTS